jgi:Glycosyl transferases group 1
MSRVLLVCPEPLGHRQPAGIGIRFLEIANVLRAAGHSVEILSPDQGLSPENIARGTSEADVAVVQGHVANDLFAHMKPLPVVVDLYDPFIVENLHYFKERGAEVFTHDHATLISSLLKGDLFLCASEAQRLFYLGMMLAVGRMNPVAFDNDPHLDSLIRIAPFGVAAGRALPSRASTAPEILFGGIYDWYDPILAMEAVAIARAKIPMLKLTFNTHPNPELTPQGRTAEAIKHAHRKEYDFVRFEPWVAYDERAAFFDRFTIALMSFPQSIETDLAMRTRIYDYLWAGLPIITSSAPGTDELLERYRCGSIIRGEDAPAFASEIVGVLTDHARYEQMVSGTRSFVIHHQWERTLRPLVDFCANPAIDKQKSEFAASLHVPRHPPTILQRLKRRMSR